MGEATLGLVWRIPNYDDERQAGERTLWTDRHTDTCAGVGDTAGRGAGNPGGRLVTDSTDSRHSGRLQVWLLLLKPGTTDTGRPGDSPRLRPGLEEGWARPGLGEGSSRTVRHGNSLTCPHEKMPCALGFGQNLKIHPEQVSAGKDISPASLAAAEDLLNSNRVPTLSKKPQIPHN